MAEPKSDYLERLLIINYLEIQHLKKALYEKLGISDDAHLTLQMEDGEIRKLLEQKNIILMKILDEMRNNKASTP